MSTRHRIISIAGVLVAGIVLHGFAQLTPLTEEDIILAYKISAETEQTINANDGKASAVWDLWEQHPGELDKVRLVPSLNEDCKGHGDGFSSESDAQIEFRMCWSDKGLYVLAECTDDHWARFGDDSIGYGMMDWAYDYCDIIFDKLNRSEMIEAGKTEDPSVFGRPGRYAWTKTHDQFMYTFAGDSGSDEFKFYRYEEQTDHIFKYTFGFDDAKDFFDGFWVEMIKTVDPQVRQLEWYFPWSAVTSYGMNTPALDDRIGVELKYNDADQDPVDICHLTKYPGEGHWDRTYDIDPVSGDTLDTILHYGSYMDLVFSQSALISGYDTLKDSTALQLGNIIVENNKVFITIDGDELAPQPINENCRLVPVYINMEARIETGSIYLSYTRKYETVCDNNSLGKRSTGTGSGHPLAYTLSGIQPGKYAVLVIENPEKSLLDYSLDELKSMARKVSGELEVPGVTATIPFNSFTENKMTIPGVGHIPGKQMVTLTIPRGYRAEIIDITGRKIATMVPTSGRSCTPSTFLTPATPNSGPG
jgi:hypothetical protein